MEDMQQQNARTQSGNRIRTVAKWLHAHPLVADSIGALLWAALVFLLFSDEWYTRAGLLYYVPPAVAAAWTVALCIPVALRRTHTQFSVWLFVALIIAQLLFGPALISADLLALVMLYSAIVYSPRKQSRRYVIIGFMLSGADTLVEVSSELFGPLLQHSYIDDDGLLVSSESQARCASLLDGASWSSCTYPWKTMLFSNLLVIWAAVALTCAIAFWQRARHQSTEAMRARNEAIAARDEQVAQVAAEAERARIARDMHDVVAHTLSIIIVQSDGGRYAGATNIAIARSTMMTIRSEAVHALEDMHRLLGLFSGSDGRQNRVNDAADVTDSTAQLTSNEDYANIAALIAQHNNGVGDHVVMRVTRIVAGESRPDQLDARQQTAVYRMVQESLTNARKYAGTGALVKVSETWGNDELIVDVVDNGQGAYAADDGHTPGYGLIGMRERIEGVGGMLSAGPRDSGGFRVHATIPLQQVNAQLTQPNATTQQSKPSMLAEGSLETASSHTQFVPVVDAVTGAVKRTRHVRPGSLIERISLWLQRHPTVADGMLVTVLLAVSLSASSSFYMGTLHVGEQYYALLNVMFMVLILLPLIIRRSHPQLCAVLVAAVATVELICAPEIEFGNVFVLIAVYSVSLYGPPEAKRWLWPLVAGECALLGLRAYGEARGYNTLLAWAASRFSESNGAFSNGGTLKFIGIQVTVVVFALCAIMILWGSWLRINGSNLQVLEARNKALIERQQQQAQAAANEERRRIARAIQEDVRSTLGRVIQEADDGLAMVNGEEQPTSDQIVQAFAGIGTEGRAALRRIRELLTLLRTTGMSDQADGSSNSGEQEPMNLRPAASLDEQLRAYGKEEE